jgi:hypothetical protein
VLNRAGHGRGYITVELKPVDGGDSLLTVSEEAGDFRFDDVPPGTYELHVKLSGEGSVELPSDVPTIKVEADRTITVNVILAD